MTRTALLLAAAAALAGPALAQQTSVQIGSLSCEMTGKSNRVIVSATRFDCVFDPAGGRAAERYRGTVDRFGVDLSFDSEQKLVWLVFAPAFTERAGALAGSYYGAGVDAAVGLGLGLRVLLIGDGRAISLQPASVSGKVALGAAVGLDSLTLDYRG